MRTADEIVRLWVERTQQQGWLQDKMAEIRAIYRGDVTVPLPDMDTTQPSYVPNLLQQGVDQMAGRIASVTPQPVFAPKSGTRRDVRTAQTRSRIITAWWDKEKIPLVLKRRARHLIAYGSAPVVMRWDDGEKVPCWEVRSPIGCFPSMEDEPGETVPTDVVFAYTRPFNWLMVEGYNVRGLLDTDAPSDTPITLLEYHDADHSMLIATHGMSPGPAWPFERNRAVTLENTPNPIGVTPVSIPSRIGLEDGIGQFDSMVGMYYMQAKLMALEVLAVEKSIFPDTYLESRAGETARFLSGPHDGRTGEVNIVAGGVIKDLVPSPGYMTNQTVDRLERAQRLTGGIPSEFGGESPNNIRTGRRGDAVLSATIDFPVAEAQTAIAEALRAEDVIGMELAKTFDRTATRTLFTGTGNSAKAVTYVAGDVFTDTDHTVTYPAVGTDLNSLIIGLGQRVGAGTMSKATAQQLDPYIDNPEAEHDQVIVEGLEAALLSGIQQQAAAGAIPPLAVAKLMRLVSTDRLELADAMNKVVEDALAEQQAAQQQAQQAQQAQMTPEMAMSGPAAQSLAGGAQPMSTIPGPTEGQGDLASLLSTLRKPAMTIQPMRGVERGAV